ncbi:MAG: hypothetical protein JWM31_3199, partial [Solirubrobacterales bacterium]|nr:hypothetical protein [Solirubrobacterales bacterium]
VAVSAALAADGPSRALGARDQVSADPDLTEALGLGRGALVASADLLRPTPDALAAWSAEGAVAVDLQSAAVLRVAEQARVPAAAVLLLTGPVGSPTTLDDDALAAAALEAARAGVAALGIPVSA